MSNSVRKLIYSFSIFLTLVIFNILTISGLTVAQKESKEKVVTTSESDLFTDPHEGTNKSEDDDPESFYIYDDDEKQDHWSDYFNEGDNIWENSTSEEQVAKAPCDDMSNDPEDIKFYLFRNPRREDDGRELILNNANSIRTAGFRPEQTTLFVVHGYLNNGTSDMPRIVKKGYLDAGLPYNIIIMDWGRLSSPINSDGCTLFSYRQVVRNGVPTASKRLGEFLQFLIDNRFTTTERLRLVGHSLGAHVSGRASGIIASDSKNEGKKVSRISGLDPAGPYFGREGGQRRLTKENANFVDIYNTNSGVAGVSETDDGHANFIPNGGTFQTGCGVFNAQCSHAFAWRFYTKTITEKYTVCSCELGFDGRCPSNCAAPDVLAGDPCPPSARGRFYLRTGAMRRTKSVKPI